MRYLRDPRPLLFRKSRRIRRWWQTACRTDCRLRQCTAAGLYRESLHSGCRSSSGSSWIPCRLSDLLYWKTGFLPPSHKQRPTRSNEWYHFRPSADCRRRSGRYNPVRRTGVLPFLHRQMCPRRSVRRLWSPLPWSHCFPVPAASPQPLSLYRWSLPSLPGQPLFLPRSVLRSSLCCAPSDWTRVL